MYKFSEGKIPNYDYEIKIPDMKTEPDEIYDIFRKIVRCNRGFADIYLRKIHLWRAP